MYAEWSSDGSGGHFRPGRTGRQENLRWVKWSINIHKSSNAAQRKTSLCAAAAAAATDAATVGPPVRPVQLSDDKCPPVPPKVSTPYRIVPSLPRTARMKDREQSEDVER